MSQASSEPGNYASDSSATNFTLAKSGIEESYRKLINHLRNRQDLLQLKIIKYDRNSLLESHFGSKEPKDQFIQHHNAEEARLITEAFEGLDMDPATIHNIKEAILWKGRELVALSSDPPYMPSFLDKRFNTRYADAVFTLLAQLAPNIQHIEIPEPKYDLRRHLQKNNHGLLSNSFFQKLESVMFVPESNWDKESYLPFDLDEALRCFHRLPEFRMFRIQHATFHYCDIELLPGSSNLKRIEIDRCDIAGDNAANLVRSSKALQTLHLSAGGGPRTIDGGFASFYPSVLAKALLYHKDTLVKLDLDLDYLHVHSESCGSQDDDSEDEPPLENHKLEREYWKTDIELGYSRKKMADTRRLGSTVGSFADFKALQTLSIGVKFLLGIKGAAPFRLLDALPQSLEYLEIRGYKKGQNEEYDSQINELLAQKSQRLPNLGTIRGIEEEIPSQVMESDREARESAQKLLQMSDEERKKQRALLDQRVAKIKSQISKWDSERFTT